jgi:hypothetical protein
VCKIAAQKISAQTIVAAILRTPSTAPTQDRARKIAFARCCSNLAW